MTDNSELRDLLHQVANERWHEVGAPHDGDAWQRAAASLWGEFEKLGLTLVGASESVGGSGGSVAHAAEVAKTVGRYALPLPIAETAIVASWLLEQAQLRIPLGPLTFAGVGPHDDVSATIDEGRVRLDGQAMLVPWASESDYIVTVVPTADQLAVVIVDPRHLAIDEGVNVAGEPRQRVAFSGSVAGEQFALLPTSIDLEAVRRRIAFCRSLQVLGALEATRDLTLRFVQERHQFGRPIIAFQAVAQSVSRLAADVALARAAVDGAVGALDDRPSSGTVEIAAAKVMTGRAARLVSAAAHQLHGAIGITAEYPLNLSTRRLWSWQDEGGSEDEWSATLGAALPKEGGVWPLLSTVGSRAAS